MNAGGGLDTPRVGDGNRGAKAILNAGGGTICRV